MAKNQDLIKNITHYFHKHLFGIDSDIGQEFLSNGAFGVIMSPGQFFNPNWNENNIEDMYQQSLLLDETLAAAFTYSPQVGSISGLYKNITRNAALPKGELTDGQVSELDRLAAIVLEAQPAYVVYEKFYYDAFEAYEAERTLQAPDQAKLARLLNRSNLAWRDWINPRLGKKAKLERANADIAAIYRGAPQEMWVELEDRLRNFEKISPRYGSYVQTALIPPVVSWGAASTPWATFTQTIAETETHAYSKTTTWSGSLGVRWGLFNSVNLGANGAKTVTHDQSAITNIKVQFDYMRVKISRPWMDQNVFNYPFWTWKKSVQTGLLSDGGNFASNSPISPIGDMPFIPTSLIVVRNVVITADFQTSDIQTMNSLISGSVSAGFGPFTVRGNYSTQESSRDVRAEFDGTTLTIKEPQVIGFQGVLIPRSPNPDITLPFDWTEAWNPNKDRSVNDESDNAARQHAAYSQAFETYEELKSEVNLMADSELQKRYEEYLKKSQL